MAVNAYLSFFDSADGESLRKGHEKEVEVQAWDWEVEAESSGPVGGGAGVGKASPKALHWSHRYDSTSDFLLRALVTGTHIPKVQLRQYRSGGKGQDLLSLSLTFESVRIVRLADSAGDDGTIQDVAMEFDTITVEYRRQSPAGGAGVVQTLNWDIPAGTVSPSA
jgi:type VI secretion system secreted protein Hcp